MGMGKEGDPGGGRAAVLLHAKPQAHCKRAAASSSCCVLCALVLLAVMGLGKADPVLCSRDSPSLQPALTPAVSSLRSSPAHTRGWGKRCAITPKEPRSRWRAEGDGRHFPLAVALLDRKSVV